MNNVLIISERQEIIKVVKTICKCKEKTIDSSEKAVSYLKKNDPGLVILDLEVNDLNIFVAHELLKACKSDNNSKVFIVISEGTKNEIEDYKKLLHPPDEFIKDSEIIIYLDELLKKHSIPSKIVKGTEKKDAGDFKALTDEVNEDIEELDLFDNGILEDDNESNQGIFIVEDADDHSGEIDISLEDSSMLELNEIETKKNNKKKIEKEQLKKGESTSLEVEKQGNNDAKVSELNAEILSLEKQNKFMKNENKELLIENNDLKKKSTENNSELTNYKEELKDLKKDLENTKNDNIDKLSVLTTDIDQIKSDKKILESSLMDEISILKSDKSDLEKEKDQIKDELESITKNSKDFEKQLDLKTKEIANLKKEIGSIEKAKDEKEKILISSIDHLKKNITTEEGRNKDYKKKIDKITKISKNLSEIIEEQKLVEI